VLACMNAPALADNLNSAGTKTQIAYLTPMVDLQHSRDMASSAYQATQFASALQQYQNICQSTAANAKDYYWLGETYFHLSRYSDAAQTFEKTVAFDPRMDSVRVRVVQSYLFNKQPQIAKEKCAAAINVVTDPIVRQLNGLQQSCDQALAPRMTRGVQRHRGSRLGEQ
jgi:predicted Zn-dependent protease